ncbi:Phosphatidylinositol N-acetylglucosaminyltransferase subunit gpi15 [Cladobotryum mycophilum]|uniref:Phosphatidylinositol N-acetylglucosaminyltransferase subunit gpi15 n=1 Tax=Cladobotryum mycophilum TaxID=491253 RepID=A0ABR0SZ56_9HYPO
MLTTAPRLRIRRPSPTTAEFTVTTLPPETLPLRLLWILLLLMRLLLSLTAVLILYARWVQERGRFTTGPQPNFACPAPSPLSLDQLLCSLESLQTTPAGVLLARAASSVPLPVLVPAALVIVYGLSLRVHTQESLLVLRGLGVQTSESPATYLAKPATRFIPTEKIQDIFVNEAFRGFAVRYYLVVVVEGEDDVVVVFPSLLPRRKIVETVWRGVRECLYEGRGEDKAQVQGMDKS